jgi:hypothetical protein
MAVFVAGVKNYQIRYLATIYPIKPFTSNRLLAVPRPFEGEAGIQDSAWTRIA